MKSLLVGLWILVAAVGCTKRNTAVCCTDPANCTMVGLPDGSRCEPGNSCVDNSCVASACTLDTDCPAAMSHCTDGVCIGCDAAHPCAADAPVCAMDTTCQACATNADCAAFPGLVCDPAAGCRACAVDSECDSQVCDAGACLPSDGILYVSETGVDNASCSLALPCGSIQHALTLAHAGVVDLVTLGTIKSDLEIDITASTTSATELHIHGNAATISGGDTAGAYVVNAAIPLLIRDVVLTRHAFAGTKRSAGFNAAVELEHVTFDSGGLIFVSNVLTAHDLTVINCGQISMGSSPTITIDRGVILETPLRSAGNQFSVTLNLNNVVMTSSTFGVLQLLPRLGGGDPVATGTIRSSSLTGAGNGPVLVCGPSTTGLSVDSSIVWGSAAPSSGGCVFSNSIAGPTTVTGALNADPKFVDAQLHIAADSPARDAVDCGTNTLDFEGDPRPQGARCDTGADEYHP